MKYNNNVNDNNDNVMCNVNILMIIMKWNINNINNDNDNVEMIM